MLHHLPRAPGGHTLRPVSVGAQPQVLLPLHSGLHLQTGLRERGVLPQRGEVPPRGLQRALGLHARRDLYDPGG